MQTHCGTSWRSQRPRRFPWLALASLWLLAIAYGSLLPFEWRAPPDALWMNLPGALSWREPPAGVSKLGVSAAASDVLANALLYLPVGLLLTMGLKRYVRWHALAAAGATLIAFGVSFTVECVQLRIIGRCGAWNDVLVNTLAAGVAAAWTPVLRVIVFASAQLSYRAVQHARRHWRAMAHRRNVQAALVLVFPVVSAIVLTRYLDHWSAEQRPDALTPNFWPLWWHFVLPYDMGLVLLARTLAVYGFLAAGTWAWARLARLPEPASASGLVVLCFAAGVTVWRIHAGRTAGDVTELLLACLAVLCVRVAIALIQRAGRQGHPQIHQMESR